MKKTKIVIAGGGFAGLTAATHLEKRLEAAAYYPDLSEALVRVVLVHPGRSSR